MDPPLWWAKSSEGHKKVPDTAQTRMLGLKHPRAAFKIHGKSREEGKREEENKDFERSRYGGQVSNATPRNHDRENSCYE